MNAAGTQPKLLLIGDDGERLLRMARTAIERGFTVTLSASDVPPAEGYAGVALALCDEAACATAQRQYPQAVVLSAAHDDAAWCDQLAAGNGTSASKMASCVVASTFRVANGMAETVAQAFRDRPRRVDRHQGFVDLHVMSPQDDPTEFWLVTSWADVESYTAWHHSHLYREAHTGIPRGLRLDPTATRVRVFRSIAR